jgi:hypothetical protein
LADYTFAAGPNLVVNMNVIYSKGLGADGDEREKKYEVKQRWQ